MHRINRGSGHSALLDRRRLVAALSLSLAAGTALPGSSAARQDGHGLTTHEPATDGLANLQELLALIPATTFDAPESAGLIWVFADVATQLASLGVELPGDFGALPDGYLNAVYPLAIGSSVYSYGMDEEFVEAIDFLPFAVHSTLFAGSPPAQVSLFRGGIDLSALPAAWIASGYAEMETAGVTWWNLGEDGSLDFEHPIQRRVISALNNVAILDDVVVACGTIGSMEQVIKAWTGVEESLAGHADTQRALAGLKSGIVSAAGFNPVTYFAATAPPPDLIAESDSAVGPMPELDAIVTGITAGFHAISNDGLDAVTTPAVGLDASRVVIRLAAGSSAESADAAAVAAYRWQTAASLSTGQPLDELMPLVSAEVDDDVVVLTFEQATSPRAWFDIFLNQDTFAFAPSG